MKLPLNVVAPHVAGVLDLIVQQLGDYIAENGEDPQGVGSTTLSKLHSVALTAEMVLRDSIKCQQQLDADESANVATANLAASQ